MATAYYLLARAEGEEDVWKLIGQTEATSADSAIRALIAKNGSDISLGRGLVAVPVRSWNPRKAKVQTNTKVSFT